jgi:hypothetical protein
MEANNLFRYGNILIKYRLCPNDTKHLFCIEYNKKYYSFIMNKGEIVNQNDKKINSFIKSSPKGKFFNEYKKSSLNLIN